MNHITNSYPYFPEKWPHTDKHYRFTFMLDEEDRPYNRAVREASHYLQMRSLSDMLMEHLHLWEMATELVGESLVMYTNSNQWLALAKLQHGSNLRSPIHMLRRVESWYNSSHPLPE